MSASRLALAAVVSLRAVLVYGEATQAATAPLTWRELLPARRRALPPPPRRLPAGGRTPVRALTGPSA
jgi:hypothetical protein